MTQPFMNVIGCVWVKFDGHEYELTYDSRVDVIQLERRTMAAALRQLADAFDAQAEAVGD